MLFGRIAELGIALTDLWDHHADWSQATFGTDDERGPLGPLKHLEKEAAEAQAAWLGVGKPEPEGATKFMEELGDCLLLLLDATRRGGLSLAGLVRAAADKLKVNRTRQWPKAQDANAPVEHVKESQS